MRAIWILACVVVAALAAPRSDTATATPVDSFITLIKAFEQQPFFEQATTAFRVLTFEMLTAAQSNHLALLLDRLGYVKLLRYLDALPQEYSHRFISYSILHLQAEGVPADQGFVVV